MGGWIGEWEGEMARCGRYSHKVAQADMGSRWLVAHLLQAQQQHGIVVHIDVLNMLMLTHFDPTLTMLMLICFGPTLEPCC